MAHSFRLPGSETRVGIKKFWLITNAIQVNPKLTSATMASSWGRGNILRMQDPILKIAVDELIEKHGCHTVILYGSRARGDYTDESDYDIVGFRDHGEKLTDSRIVDGKFLDPFVYPNSDVIGKEENFLFARNGKVMFEKDSFGKNLLTKLEEIFQKGPEIASASKKNHIAIWIKKSLARAERGDIESNFRRCWLLYEILEGYFIFSNQWYLGPKESFKWLKQNDSMTYALFDRALKPSASLEELRALVQVVLQMHV